MVAQPNENTGRHRSEGSEEGRSVLDILKNLRGRFSDKKDTENSKGHAAPIGIVPTIPKVENTGERNENEPTTHVDFGASIAHPAHTVHTEHTVDTVDTGDNQSTVDSDNMAGGDDVETIIGSVMNEEYEDFLDEDDDVVAGYESDSVEDKGAHESRYDDEVTSAHPAEADEGEEIEETEERPVVVRDEEEESTADTLRERVEDVTDTFSEKLGTAFSTVKEKLSDAKDYVGERVDEYNDNEERKKRESSDDNPLEGTTEPQSLPDKATSPNEDTGDEYIAQTSIETPDKNTEDYPIEDSLGFDEIDVPDSDGSEEEEDRNLRETVDEIEVVEDENPSETWNSRIIGDISFKPVEPNVEAIIERFLQGRNTLNKRVQYLAGHGSSFSLPFMHVNSGEITFDETMGEYFDVRESLTVIVRFLESIGVKDIRVDVLQDGGNYENIRHYALQGDGRSSRVVSALGILLFKDYH